MNKKISLTVAAICALTATGVTLAQVTPGSTPTAFKIDAPAMSQALLQFTEQSHLQLAFASDEPLNLKAPRVEGTLTPRAALDALLKGTSLKYEFVNDRTVSIRMTDGSPGPFEKISTQYRAAPAQSPQNQEGNPPRTGRPAENDSSASDLAPGALAPKDIEQVVVTGTNIRGVPNNTVTSNSFNRETIERSGYTTAEQFIRSLPQDFRGGATGATEDGKVGGASNALQNNEGATGVNLRGLGTSSTLVLFNGRRLAPAAFGGITDISTIPLAALSRIDVVTDGSSAIYGGDAVAGVVNFIPRSDYHGAETQIRYGNISRSGMHELLAGQTAGISWQGGNILGSVQFLERTALRSGERDFTAQTPQPTDIAPETKKYSGFFSYRQDFDRGIGVFSDALLSRKKLLSFRSTSPTAGTDSDVESDQYSVNVGVRKEIGAWELELTGNLADMKTELVWPRARPLPTPTYVEGMLASRTDANVAAAEIKATGDLFALPGGYAKAALGLGRRNEEFEALLAYLPTTNPLRVRTVKRDVNSGYAELYLPWVGESNSRRLLHKFESSFAVRWDDYSDFGDSTNPKVGIMWAPTPSLAARAAWSTSFRAPIANELLNRAAGTSVSSRQLTAAGGTGTANVLLVGGVSPDIDAEEATSWSGGVDYSPQWIEGATVGVSYYDIDFKNRIIQPPFVATILSQPSVYGSLITPIASDQEAAAYLSQLVAQGATYTNLAGFGTTGVRNVVNIQLQNAAFVKQSGLDLHAQYAFNRGSHRFDTGVSFSWIREIVTALTEQSTPTDVVDTFGNPLSKRIRATFGWSNRGWLLFSAINYRGSYTDTSTLLLPKVAAWTTADLSLQFAPDFVAESSPLSGTRFALSVINLFDRDPPFVSGSVNSGAQPNIHYDAGNADPYGRQVSFEIRKRW